MKYKFLGMWLTVILLLVTSLQSAVVRNQPVSVKQPNGSTLRLFTSGDEYFNYLHDSDGNMVLQSELDGYYYYAFRSSTKYDVTNSRADKRLVPANGVKNPVSLEKKSSSRQGKMRSFVSYKTGTLKNLCMMIRFADQTEFTTPRSDFEDRFNALGKPSVKQYFKDISKGTLDYTTTIYPLISDKSKNLSYKDIKPRAYFMPYNAVTNKIGYKYYVNYANPKGDSGKNRIDSLLSRAIMSIYSQVTFKDYDMDPSSQPQYYNRMDNVTFIFRGYEDDTWNEAIWPRVHSMSYLIEQRNPAPDEGTFSYFETYTQLPENRSDVATMCHEATHILGFPDLYHSGNQSQIDPTGIWDVMGSSEAAYPSNYTRWKYSKKNWLSDVKVIRNSGTYTINSNLSTSNNLHIIKVPNGFLMGSEQYYAVEYKKKGNFFDRHLPGEGLVFFKIDSMGTDDGNLDTPRDEVYVYRENGTMTYGGNPNFAYFSANGGKTEFSDNTNPKPWFSHNNNKYLSYASGGIRVYDISESGGDQMSYKIEIPNNSTQSSKITLNPGLAEMSFTKGQKIVIGSTVVSPSWTNHCKLYVDGNYVATANYNASLGTYYEFQWNSSTASFGKHTVRIDALANGTTVSGSLTFNLYLKPMSESFESSFSQIGWSTTVNGVADTTGWKRSKYLSKSGSYSAYATINHKGEAVLMSPTMSITSPGYLEFWWANNDVLVDKSRVTIVDSTICEIYNGVKWVEVAKLKTAEFSPAFDRVTVDVTPYLNKSVQFRWINRGSGNFNGIGTAVDDVVLNLADNNEIYWRSPLNGSSHDQNGLIPISVVANVQNGVKAVFYVDGKKIGESAYPYSYNIPNSTIKEGVHDLKVEIQNSSNQTLTTSTISITIQNESYIKHLATSPNGYAWSRAVAKKITYNPADNSVMAIYRPKNNDDYSLNSGLFAVSGSWGNLNHKKLYENLPGTAGTRYHTLFSYENFHFVMAPNCLSGSSLYGGIPTIAVYNSATNIWSDTTAMHFEGKILPDAYMGTGAATKDASGKFHAVAAWIDGYTKNGQYLIYGQSTDGIKWQWSDYEKNALYATKDFGWASRVPKVAVNKNGLAIAMTVVTPINFSDESLNNVIGFAYSQDYGKTFNFANDAECKYFRINPKSIFSWVGKSFNGKVIDKVKFGDQYDLHINDNGDINFIIKVEGINVAYGVPFAETDDKTPVTGIYNIQGKKSGSSFIWTPYLIASRVGGGSKDDKPLSHQNVYEWNSGRCQIGSAGNILFATWLDRTHKNPQKVEQIGNKLNMDEFFYSFHNDIYFSYSVDGGQTWRHDTNYAGEKYGVNLSNTPNLTEDGFSATSFGRVQNNVLDFYATYQYASLNQPIFNQDYLIDYVNELYLRKFSVDLANMRLLYGEVVDNENSQLDFSLQQNYPNPFNPQTMINFNLSSAAKTSLEIYNVKGELVQVLVSKVLNAGSHSYSFNASGLNSGVYFYKLTNGTYSDIKKMVLVK